MKIIITNYFLSKKKFIKYSFFAKLLHWSFVFIFVYGIYKQVDDIQQLDNFSLLTFEMIFAFFFLALLIIRFIYMTKTQTSSLPQETNIYQKIFSKLIHLGMYLSISLIAITGISIGLLYYFGLKEGNIISTLVAFHEFSVFASYWMIALHLLGASYHRFKKDRVWNAMVPFWKTK